jgi:Tfp pilus assembly protein PilX
MLRWDFDPMLRTLVQAFTSPVAGPLGFALSIAMCAMLVATVFSAERNEAAMQARISALTAENQRNGIALHARLAACEGGPADLARTRATNAALTPEQRAQRLAGEPAGFDVCARMESADRAVLETLR